jgi:hypothetical protein
VLLVALLSFPSLELSATVLELLCRMSIYTVSGAVASDCQAHTCVPAVQSVDDTLRQSARGVGDVLAEVIIKNALCSPKRNAALMLCCPQEAKTHLAAASVLPSVLAFVTPSAPEALQAAALRLLNNLAFDTELRREMVQAGVMTHCADILLCQPPTQGGTPVPSASRQTTQRAAAAAHFQLQPLALGLLYLATMECGARTALAATYLLPRWGGCHQMSGRESARAPPFSKPHAMKRPLSNRLCDGVLRSSDLRAVPELIALVVNATCDAGVAEVSVCLHAS